MKYDETLDKLWKMGDKTINTGFFHFSSEGELIIKEGGKENSHEYNVHEIIKEYGSPLRIYMPFVVSSRIKRVFETFHKVIREEGYTGGFAYHYPMKSNQTKEIIEEVLKAGTDIEVTSANELSLIASLWKKGETRGELRVLCNGPKSDVYIELIRSLHKKGMNIIPIVENLEEFRVFKKFAGPIGVRVSLSIGVDSRWSKEVSRFGLTEDEVLSLPKTPNITMLHFHVGSQIGSKRTIFRVVERGALVYKKLKKKQTNLSILDIGGGFGVPYTKKKIMYDVPEVALGIVKRIKRTLNGTCPHPQIVVEWGQYAVAPSQMTVYNIIFQKDIRLVKPSKKWYVIDGSFMNDLPDTWAIGQQWHIVPANRAYGARHAVWLAGSSCDSDDEYVVKDLRLPKLSKTEELYIAILDTGAYQEALSSQHCLLDNPEKLMLTNGKVKILRRRDSAREVGKELGW